MGHPTLSAQSQGPTFPSYLSRGCPQPPGSTRSTHRGRTHPSPSPAPRAGSHATRHGCRAKWLSPDPPGGNTGLGTAWPGTRSRPAAGSHLHEGRGGLRAVADLEAEPVETGVPGGGVGPVHLQPLWCFFQCLHCHIDWRVWLHCWGKVGSGPATTPPATPAPSDRGSTHGRR